jgi:hypothetical protein
MILFILIIFCRLACVNFKYIGNNGVDNDICGTVAAPCKTFGYIFYHWKTVEEKGVLIPDNYAYSSSEEIVMNKSFTKLYMCGANYSAGLLSYIVIPDKSGHITCDQNAVISFLRFATNGIFYSSLHGLIYIKQKSGEVTISNCIFGTSDGYDPNKISNIKLSTVVGDSVLNLQDVEIYNFTSNQIVMGESKFSTVNFTYVKFFNYTSPKSSCSAVYLKTVQFYCWNSSFLDCDGKGQSLFRMCAFFFLFNL